MPRSLRSATGALGLAGTAVLVSGCGGGGGPDPSIPKADAGTLLARIQEIKANVDNGSCLVASDRTTELISEIQSLPPTVINEVKASLQNGANNLKLLLADPSQCQGRTTTEQTTTPETLSTTVPTTPATTSTTHTQTQAPPTTTQPPTQTIPPNTPGASGGIGPG